MKNLIVPAEIIIKLLPVVEVNKEAEYRLAHGSPLFLDMLVNKAQAIKIIDSGKPFLVVLEDKLMEAAKKAAEGTFENKNILAKPEAVL